MPPKSKERAANTDIKLYALPFSFVIVSFFSGVRSIRSALHWTRTSVPVGEECGIL